MTADLDGLTPGWLRSKPGIKWASAAPGEIAAWVADMDFPIPPIVAGAIARVVEDGDLGYPDLRGGPRLAEPFVRWTRSTHGVHLEPDHIREFDDVLNAVQAVLSVTVPNGGTVAIHTPTYPPFLDTIDRFGYRMEAMPFHLREGRWRFDLEAAAAAVERADAVIVVNPHNPTGRVLDRSELEVIVDAARATGTVVVADEVHADLVYQGHRHLTMAGMEPEAVTIMSATKAFNMAGIRCAVAHIGSDIVRERLAALPHHLFGAVSNLSVVATAAAWTDEGARWLSDVRSVLERNRTIVMERMPEGFDAVAPEATYLAWIDTRGRLGEDPARRIREDTGLILSRGSDFGPDAGTFVRLNFATGRSILTDIMDRMNQI